MWAVTGIEPNLLKSIFIKPVSTIQEAINSALEEKGREKILFMMNASLTVPKLRKRLIHRTKKFIYTIRWEKEFTTTLFEDIDKIPAEKKEEEEILTPLLESG